MRDADVASRILTHAAQGARLRETFFAANAEAIADAAISMAVCLAKGGKILLCGNGGSAADAQHLAGELVNRFLINRPPLAAVALTTDSSVMTAIGNDFSFDLIFARQVQALGNPGDILIGISTSGNSENVVRALENARANSLITIGFSGKNGGRMGQYCDTLLAVDAETTPLIQEIHIALGHLLCELTDYFLFENTLALTPYIKNDDEQ